MAGVLSFTLGLEASKFLSTLNLASGQILGFAGAMNGLGRIVEGVWSAIERGGALTDLSNRTGESVRNLYQLQESFKVVGVGGENVAPMLLRMQKALSGVDEAGQSTVDIFAALNIDLSQLKGMDAPRQIATLAQALQSLPREQAVGLASRLFGREGAGNFLQIARDFKGFQQSMRDSSGSADVVARTAAAFDEIGDTIATIKSKVGGMFAGIAEGVAPTLQTLLNVANGIDWVGIGKNIGTMLAGIAKAFQMGELGGLVMETLSAAFDSLPALALAGIQKLGVLLLEAFRTPLVYLQTGLEYAIDQAANNPRVRGILNAATMGKSELALRGMGFGDAGQTTSWQQMFSERMATGPEFFMQGLGLGDLDKSANEALSKALQGMKDKFGPIWERFAALGASGFSMNAVQNAAGNGDFGSVVGKKAKDSDVSEWEKMGFVMRGGGGGSDYARNTADNTRLMLAQQRETNRLLAPKQATGLTGID